MILLVVERGLKAAGQHEVKGETESMYEPHQYTGFRWAMAIDLNKCTGCAVCFDQCPVHAIEMFPEPK